MKKEFNQYYGQYVEEAVCAIINGDEIKNNTNHDFSDEDLGIMYKAARAIAANFASKKCIYIGRKTNKTNGDLLIDDQVVEVKFVSKGTGTYFNTSLNYIQENLNFPSYSSYLKKAGYIQELKEHFGDDVSETNSSPVNIKTSSRIRHEYPTLYKTLTQHEESIRINYLEDLYQHFLKNEEDFFTFINDMISKEKSGKKSPDIIIIYNYTKGMITVIDKNYLENCKNNKTIKNTGKGLSFDLFRIAIGWQNGNGLNNPTIRVFIN